MMSDQEMEKLIQDIEDGKSINFNDQFKMLATNYKKINSVILIVSSVKQHYTLRTNNNKRKLTRVDIPSYYLGY